MKKIAGITVFLLAIAPLVLSFSLILKNGKKVEGELVSEDAERFSIKDKDGVVLNFKKSVVDLEQTAAANKQPEKKEITAKESEKVIAPETPVKPKKPARVYNATDLNRLRSEYPMESGAGVQFEEGKAEAAPKGRSGEEWQAITQSLLAQVKEAEGAYKDLSTKCAAFQGSTIQTHIAITPEGKETDLVQAKEQTCQNAEDAKTALEAARQEYAAAVEQARQENVPRGYIATE